MKERILKLGIDLKQPWLLAVLFAVSIPLLPEYFAPLLAVGSLMAAYYDAAARRRGFQVGTLGKLMLLYIAYMALGLLYTQHFLSTLSTLGMWVVMFMVYLSMTTVLTDHNRFDAALLGIAVIAGIIGLIGCVEYMLRVMLGCNISVQFWSFLDNTVLSWLPIELYPLNPNGGRVASTFNNPNIFAEYLVMALPFIAYYSFYGRRKGAHLLSRFCLLMVAGGIAFSFSRGSYMALLAVTLVFCIANIRKIMLVILTMASALLLVPQPVIARLFSVTNTDAAIGERMNIWFSGLGFVKENPLFGVGAGVSNSWSLLLQKGIDAPHMHNLVLQLLIEGGIVALIIFVVAGWKLLYSSFSMLVRDGESHMVGVMFVGFLVGFVMDSMADFPLLTPKLVGVFLMMVALSDCAARLHLDHESSSLSDVLAFRQRLPEPNSERVVCTRTGNQK